MWRAVAAASAPARALLRAPRRAVSVAVSPAAGLADERVETRVTGLGPGQPVTLRALAADERGCLFQSCAHYRADGRGELHLSTDASHGGDYTGVEPMGLFWSLAPAGMERPYQRLVPRSTGTPMKVEMSVHRGHSLPGAIPGPVVAKADVERWFTVPGVRRIRLKEGGVRGSLFLPPGDGPFPGVIDMYGDEGGLIEFRSSLLATHGFAALSLPYFDFEDLPKVMKEFKLEYFEEAARFLQRHPKAKATTIKEALAKWEEKNGQKASEAKEVKLYGQIPPVERMDESLSTLVNCEKLSLSTNCIERIANLNSLKNLRILSLGRNNIKNLNGLEAVADTLEELWISYNFIEKLRGIRVMKKLKVLYMSNNLVKDWAEFVRLAELPLLEDLVFVGNPLQEKYASDQKNNWIEEATKRVPKLKKLDGILVIKQEEDEEGAN
ncbi:peroxisomal succinyl-coenzyme A thioesterase-like isoform X3 [Falco biarmicus]|uniref:peroxisomal succinyl-coenzyme A thioesterase isoform X3 n=1 Tax=Falco cherrug TaxID=345164 RepID=UPI00188666C1|nr:peroxisomal succinyl-coenzyme A thioesterase isoform X3 [Falco cherrug]XP_037251320.1 peroxisomal succinyl-coenzyme A thioesterase-like isoform X3 [Falco rusticolus]XP_056203492.1 peroxisomal succinyl-coenzyme A thioesterase-like isoform X3 [Falco biarmicus]